MEQRDYLLRQIELMTQTLVNLIRRLLGLKELNEEETQQATDEMLKENMGISLAEILSTAPDKIVDVILQQGGIHETNVDLFAEVLVINANASAEAERKRILLVAALELYNWLDNKTGTFSIERHQKMNDIRIQLES